MKREHVALERILYLDGWRGLAILAVIFAHFGTISVFNAGRFGVEMFFVLSGRLMAQILFERNTPLAEFFPRRISRVWPALFAMVSVSLIATLILKRGDVTLGAWVSAISFTYNYATLFGVHSSWIEHTWSLCVEEHMYILLGVLSALRMRFKFNIKIVMAFIAVMMIANGAVQDLAFGGSYYDVYWRSDVRGASIILGATLYLYLAGRSIPEYIPVSAIGVAFVLNLNVVPDPVKYSLGTLALAIGVAAMNRIPSFALRVLTDPRLLFVGAISYSLYLWQQPFSKLIPTTGSLVLQLSARAALLLVAVLVAWFSYQFVEAPARRFLNNAFANWREGRSCKKETSTATQ